MSVRIRAVDAAFAYPDAPPLLTDLQLDLGPGWTAIAGPNGAGKTTLLRLLAGELSPTGGQVRREPATLRLARCAQSPRAPTDAVQAFAWCWDAPARRLRARLGLDPMALERWPSLSPGERQRWQLAAALDAEPGALLLDEPTNHLDAEARALLLDALRDYDGVGVIVAHDRAFLDALATQTVWVDRGTATLRPGDYSAARAQMDADAARRVHLRREGKKERARLRRELDARRVRQATSERAIKASTRITGPRDSDARSALRKGRAEHAAAKHATAVARVAGRVAVAEARVQTVQTLESLGGALFVDYEPSPKSVLVSAQLDALVAGERTLLDATSLVVRRDDRIRIAGPNGAGKTTLLRAVLDAWALPRERLLFLPQELPATAGPEALSRLHALPSARRGETLKVVAALGVDPKPLLRTRSPSPGETRKLLLAEALARRVWCVVLDEPTNHLDVASIERLEAALADFPGALLLVTHDARLAERVTDHTWALGDGTLRRM